MAIKTTAELTADRAATYRRNQRLRADVVGQTFQDIIDSKAALGADGMVVEPPAIDPGTPEELQDGDKVIVLRGGELVSIDPFETAGGALPGPITLSANIIDENVPPLVVIGTLSVQNVGSHGQPDSYFVEGVAAGRIATADEFLVTGATNIDYEATPTLTPVVGAQWGDATNGFRIYDTFTINVNDLPDNYAAETQQFFDRLYRPPGGVHIDAHDDFIQGLVTDEVWDHLDICCNFWAVDRFCAQTNLVNGTFNATMFGDVPFSLTHGGFSGTADLFNQFRFDLNFSETPNKLYARDSAMMAVWIEAGPGAGLPSAAVLGSSSGNYAEIFPHAADNHFYSIANDAGVSTDGGAGVSTGFFAWVRDGANSVTLYRNAAPVATDTNASDAVVDAQLCAMIANNQPAFATIRVGAIAVGEAPADPDAAMAALYARWAAYRAVVVGLSGEADQITKNGGTITLVDDTKFNFVHGAAKLPNGDILMVYNSADDGGSVNGIWKEMRRIGGVWGSASTFYTPSAGDWTGDVSVETFSDDTVVVSGFYFQGGDVDEVQLMTFVSDDGGATFDGPYYPDPQLLFGTWAATSGRIIELPEDAHHRYAWPVYGEHVSGLMSCGLIFSDDLIEWEDGVIIAQGTAAEQYNEAQGFVVPAPSKRLVIMIRHDVSATTTGYSRVISEYPYDIYSDPIDVISNQTFDCGRPALMQYEPGKVFMTTRFGAASASRWLFSIDDCLKWTPCTADDVVGSEVKYFYAAEWLEEPGVIGRVLSRQQTFSEADIVYDSFNVT